MVAVEALWLQVGSPVTEEAKGSSSFGSSGGGAVTCESASGPAEGENPRL